MINVGGSMDGVSAVFIGLSDRDLTRLKTGRPLAINPKIARDLGLGKPVIVFNKRSDTEMMATLETRGAVPQGSTEQTQAMEFLAVAWPALAPLLLRRR